MTRSGFVSLFISALLVTSISIIAPSAALSGGETANRPTSNLGKMTCGELKKLRDTARATAARLKGAKQEIGEDIGDAQAFINLFNKKRVKLEGDLKTASEAGEKKAIRAEIKQVAKRIRSDELQRKQSLRDLNKIERQEIKTKADLEKIKAEMTARSCR